MKSHALVALQMLSIAALLLTTNVRALPPASWGAIAAAGLLLLWAVASLRVGHFNIRPDPVRPGALVTHGPYRHVRHPMYAASLLGGLALLAAPPHPERVALWLILFGVLWAKATYEEHLLSAHHAEYAAYRARTRRLVPWVL